MHAYVRVWVGGWWWHWGHAFVHGGDDMGDNIVVVVPTQNDDDYDDILDDMREEASRHGTLVNVVIPRPTSAVPVPQGGSRGSSVLLSRCFV